MKKIMLVLVVCLISVDVSYAGVSSVKYIKQAQARNYIEHVVQSLFMPSMHTQNYIQELDLFIADVTQRLLTEQAIIDKRTTIKYYKALVLCEKLLPAVLEFIQEKSKIYAYQELALLHTTMSSARQQEIVRNVTTQIKNKASNIIYYADPFPAGALMQYMGAPLRTKVATSVKAQVKKQG